MYVRQDQRGKGKGLNSSGDDVEFGEYVLL